MFYQSVSMPVSIKYDACVQFQHARFKTHSCDSGVLAGTGVSIPTWQEQKWLFSII